MGCTVSAARTLRSRSLSGWQRENTDERLRDCKASSRAFQALDELLRTSCAAALRGRQRLELLGIASCRTKILAHTSMQGPFKAEANLMMLCASGASGKQGQGCAAPIQACGGNQTPQRPRDAQVAAAAQVWAADAPPGVPAVSRPSETC